MLSTIHSASLKNVRKQNEDVNAIMKPSVVASCIEGMGKDQLLKSAEKICKMGGKKFSCA